MITIILMVMLNQNPNMNYQKVTRTRKIFCMRVLLHQVMRKRPIRGKYQERK